MKTKGIIAAIIALICLGAAGAVGIRWFAYNRYDNFAQKAVVLVYPGTDASKVYDEICENAGVKHPKLLKHQFEKQKVAEKLKPGRYVINPGKSSAYVARMLVFGWQTPCSVVLTGNLRVRSFVAKKISGQLMVEADSLFAMMKDSTALAEFDVTPETVFSLFIPDTYEIWWTATPHDILAKFAAARDNFWNLERKAKAKALGLTPMEVTTLASIVNGESNHEPEYPQIAGVYLNRLRKGMRLQACPTVCYIYDYAITRVLNQHINTESPYNTYLHAGLPPAPICCPTKAAIDAVLNPSTKPYFYFCADPSLNGTHRFAETYAEHQKNADAYQKAYEVWAKKQKKK